MKVKLLKDQYYLAAAGGRYCGKKGDIIDIDPLFAKHIRENYEVVKGGAKEDEDAGDNKNEKPLEKMNKAELTEKVKALGVDLTDEEVEGMTKAEIIKVIVNTK